jgi:hypothetical protein
VKVALALRNTWISNMKKYIPAPVIAVLADNLPNLETHAGLDNLFFHADAPGEPPEGSKPIKTQAWLRRVNKESDNPLSVLGKLIECYMEIPEQDEDESWLSVIWKSQSKMRTNLG